MYSTCKLLSLRSSPFPDSTACAAVTSSSAKLQVKIRVRRTVGTLQSCPAVKLCHRHYWGGYNNSDKGERFQYHGGRHTCLLFSRDP